MSAEEEYVVSHVRRIEVTQVVTARSKAEAMRKLRYGEERFSDWLHWETIGEPTRFRASRTAQAPLSDSEQALLDEQRDAAGPGDDLPW